MGAGVCPRTDMRNVIREALESAYEFIEGFVDGAPDAGPRAHAANAAILAIEQAQEDLPQLTTLTGAYASGGRWQYVCRVFSLGRRMVQRRQRAGRASGYRRADAARAKDVVRAVPQTDMTDPDAQPVQASPLCRSVGSNAVWLAHDLASDGVCARCGWKVPGRAVRPEQPKEEQP